MQIEYCLTESLADTASVGNVGYEIGASRFVALIVTLYALEKSTFAGRLPRV